MILRRGNFNLYGLVITLPYLTLILLLACYFIDRKGGIDSLAGIEREPHPKMDFGDGDNRNYDKRQNYYGNVTTEPVELNVSSRFVLSGVKKMEKEQGWHFSKSALSGWKILETQRFIIQSDAIKQNTLTVGFYLETFSELLCQFLTTHKDIEKRKVRYFKSERKFREFAKVKSIPTATAFYDPEEKEIVICDVGNVTDSTFISGIFHEATHQSLDEHFTKILPLWFSEGLAEYFSTAKFEDGGNYGLKVGGSIQTHIKTLKDAITDRRAIPLKRLLKMDRNGFYGDDAKLAYAESWSLASFIIEKKVTSNSQWIDEVLNGGLELEGLEDEWLEYVYKLN